MTEMLKLINKTTELKNKSTTIIKKINRLCCCVISQKAQEPILPYLELKERIRNLPASHAKNYRFIIPSLTGIAGF